MRDLGYRWGSLSVTGRLNIHCATLQLPPSLIDYVLVYVAHPQHTPAFWATVERAMPDYERRKSDLFGAGARLWMG
ncbi:M48 family metallopeptidase [Micromonospora peucetia]|uniref:M48 metallopeptidase family protein n=1 Tax=Micromonospora peucetia TaxID=47871 RepID=UPI00332F9640